MIIFLTILGLIFLLFLVVIFYNYKISFVAKKDSIYAHVDLIFVDILFRKKKKKQQVIIKLLGFFKIKRNIKKDSAKYDPNYDRIFYVVEFFFSHIKKILGFLTIERLGVHITAGFEDYYMLSQINVFNILLNNYLPGGLYCQFIPDFEKTTFEMIGKGQMIFHLNRFIWFFLKLFFVPATYLGVYEYYRYSKSVKSEK